MECKAYVDSPGALIGRTCTGSYGEKSDESLYAHYVVERENSEADANDSDGTS